MGLAFVCSDPPILVLKIMTDVVDLALNKPAIQSSICEYSRGKSVSEDAALVVGQNFDPWTFNHTKMEPLPWWEVDLGELSRIESIHIFNRIDARHRFCNFTVLYSIDGERWDVAFCKCDPKHFDDIQIPLYDQIVCRYVRIRLDANDCLHLRKVQIFGRDEPLENYKKIELLEQPASKITVFSVLFNEGSEFLIQLLDNFLNYTDDSTFFIINLPESLQLDRQSIPNSARIAFNHGQKREALGHSLLCGHLENVNFACEWLAEFDYFVPIASNSLFVREFRVDLVEQRLHAQSAITWHIDPTIIREDGGRLDLESHVWWFERVRHQQGFLEFVRDTIKSDVLVPLQIEGLLAPAEQWMSLAKLGLQLADVGKSLDRNFLFPMEEIVPATFFAAHYSQKCVSICHVFWQPFRTAVRMDHVIQPSWHFSPHISLAKWFDRSIGAPTTVAVSTERGRELVRLISESFEFDHLDDISNLCDLLRQLTNGLDTMLLMRRGYRLDLGSGTIDGL